MNEQFVETVNEIIEQKEKDMEQNLHKVVKYK